MKLSATDEPPRRVFESTGRWQSPMPFNATGKRLRDLPIKEDKLLRMVLRFGEIY